MEFPQSSPPNKRKWRSVRKGNSAQIPWCVDSGQPEMDQARD